MRSTAGTSAILFLTLAVATAGCSGGEGAAQTSSATQREVEEALGEIPVQVDTLTAGQLSGAFRAAAARALPAVVQVDVQTRVESSRGRLPFNIPGLQAPDGEQLQRGSGSGFIIDREGHILTNNHVVENAEQVVVRMADGREFLAQVVGADPNTDVAVIKIEGEDLPVSQFGDSDALKVGDWVLALGNPLGLDFTVTAGIVSAKGRNIGILSTGANSQALEAFIQTDAAINRGNSGGPLVDLFGRVIGINSAIESPTGFFTGAGFAIPINLARKVGNDLIEYGVVHRPRLGVQIVDVTEADAEAYRLPSVSGVAVSSVQSGTPAADAGIRMGDVVVEINGDRVSTVAELQARVALFSPGEEVRVTFIRNGERMERTVRLGEFERVEQRVANTRRPGDDSMPLGFTVRPASAEAVQAVSDRGSRLVEIAEIDPYGPAAGLLGRGLVLISVNGQTVSTPQDVQRIAADAERGDVVSVVYVVPQPGSDPVRINYRLR